MKTFFLFAPGDPALSRAELEAFAGRVKATREYAIADADQGWVSRLVMTRLAGEVLLETPRLENIQGLKFKSFAVRATKLGTAKTDTPMLEREIGARIQGSVNLSKPGTTIRVFTNGKKYWVTKQVFEHSMRQFAGRDVTQKPVFHPTTLKPKLARLLLNLATVRKGPVLDPFCGVGGILIEAAVLGLKAQGTEIDSRWADGCRDNIWHYKLEKLASVDEADFLAWRGGRFEAIVTDLPYGRASGLYGKKMDELYLKAFKKFREHAPRVALMAPKDVSRLLAKAGWKVSFSHSFYVHKSLRRFIHVARARPSRPASSQ
jgi:tRNA (guanine10-N2)-dimethyltransferase